ncbi:MAG TPA: divergent polysaccharide deacetylase family protein [Azospirillaceae bacterium]|nr:divergent polysaccharide deacetylase family protein [Azospirillaceae bacterium]
MAVLYATPRRTRKGRKPFLVFGLVAGVGFAGLIGWIALNADQTMEDRSSSTPSVTVPVALGEGVPLPAPRPLPVVTDTVAVVQRPASTPAQTVPPAPAAAPATQDPAQVAAVPAPPAPAAPAPAAPAPATPPPPSSQTAARPTPPPAPAAPPAPQQAVAMFPGLTPAPVPALVEASAIGPLPRISPTGQTPWQTYARPFDWSDTRPRIAIVLAGMGVSARGTQTAIERMPSGVTFAFDPAADRVANWIEAARRDGHEALLSIPMEPVAYPRVDPGPHTLLTLFPPEENRRRLEANLARATGYVGITTLSGSRFTGSADAVRPVVETLRQRGLVLLDARVADRSAATMLATQAGVPRALADARIDETPSAGLIDERLTLLERTARQNGVAVGIGMADLPVTLDRITAWAATLESKGLVLAPVTAVVNRQADR